MEQLSKIYVELLQTVSRLESKEARQKLKPHLTDILNLILEQGLLTPKENTGVVEHTSHINSTINQEIERNPQEVETQNEIANTPPIVITDKALENTPPASPVSNTTFDIYLVVFNKTNKKTDTVAQKNECYLVSPGRCFKLIVERISDHPIQVEIQYKHETKKRLLVEEKYEQEIVFEKSDEGEIQVRELEEIGKELKIREQKSISYKCLGKTAFHKKRKLNHP